MPGSLTGGGVGGTAAGEGVEALANPRAVSSNDERAKEDGVTEPVLRDASAVKWARDARQSRPERWARRDNMM